MNQKQQHILNLLVKIMKICKYCRHYVAPKYSQNQERVRDHSCKRDESVNVVTGEKMGNLYNCVTERSDKGICGVDGVKYIKKEELYWDT